MVSRLASYIEVCICFEFGCQIDWSKGLVLQIFGYSLILIFQIQNIWQVSQKYQQFTMNLKFNGSDEIGVSPKNHVLRVMKSPVFEFPVKI